MLPKIEDAKALTITQLRAQLVPTKRDALIAINGSDIVSDTISKYRKDGQIESQVETHRDIETDEVVSVKEITWTYYEKEPGCPVDTITIDEDGKKKIIKHYPDGRQPEVL